MGVAFDQPVAVLFLKRNNIKIILYSPPGLNFIPVDVHIEFHELITGQKLRQNRQREDISDLIFGERQTDLIPLEEGSAAVHPDLAAQTVEQ
ncbi:hypothetical protein D3C80_1825870 [compost metagenome]